MGLLDELRNLLKTAGAQLTAGSTTTKNLSFTKKFHAQAKSYGLTEKDAEDVYYHGEVDKWNKLLTALNHASMSHNCTNYATYSNPNEKTSRHSDNYL